MAYKRTYKRKASASSRKRYLARGKAARKKVVSTRRLKAVVKKVVRGQTETKFTIFQQIAAGNNNVNIDYGNNLYCISLIDQANIFPAAGDDRHSRDGSEYYLKGFNVWFGLTCHRGNQNMPITVYLVAVNRGYSVTNGAVTTRSIFPMSESTGSWTGTPVVVGGLEKNFGRVMKKWTIRPWTRFFPVDGNYEASGDTTTVGLTQTGKAFKMYIPVNKRITTDNNTSAEIPTMLKYKYALYFHVPAWTTLTTEANKTGWSQQYCGVQCIFKDV